MNAVIICPAVESELDHNSHAAEWNNVSAVEPQVELGERSD